MSEAVRYEKPEVLDSLPELGPAVIEASAGTGKTYTIEHLIVELVLRGTPISEILVVTFTDKATTELRTRVREKLAELVTLDTATAKPVPAGRPFWTLDARARELLAAALRGFDAATISTIHAFCQRVLTENAFENQRLFAESQVDGSEAFEAAFKEVLRSELARDPDHRALLQAFLEERGPVEELAKLLEACNREPSRLLPEYHPDRLQAALDAFPVEPEFLEGVLAELEAEKVHAATRKKSMGLLLAIQGAVLDARAEPSAPARLLALGRVLDPKEVVAYLQEKLGSVTNSHAAPGLRPGLVGPKLGPVSGSHAAPGLRPGLVDALTALAETAVSLDAAVASRFLPAIQARLAHRKQQRGQFDFQDMLALVRNCLEGPRGSALIALLRSRYRFALIDEFQDTDPVQWAIFRRIFFPDSRQLTVDSRQFGYCESDERGLFLIGDPKQAIYKFRGADVATYLAAREEVAAKTGRAPVAIRDNYRSTDGLIRAYNRILEDGATPPFFTGAIRYDNPVRCGKPALALTTADGHPVSPAQVFHLKTERTVAKAVLLPALGERIAREVRAITGPAGLVFDDGKQRRPLAFRDIFVLTRARDDGEVVGEALRRAGVPHAFYKQEGLFQSEEAESVIDLLLAVADPEDRSRRFRAWLTPFFALRLDELADAAEVPGDHALLARLRAWRTDADQGRWERLFARILEESGIVRRLILCDAGERALTNYLHLFELLLEQFGRAGKSLGEMVTGLRAYRDELRKPPGESGNMQRLETERDAVQILTMHLSKGLEAPVVFLAGGTGPSPRNRLHVFHDAANQRCAWVGEPPPAIAEQVEREARWEDERLLYVALTRAKARLYLPFIGTLGPLDPTAEAGEPLAAAALKGCYAPVNARLAAILGDAEAIRGEPPLFSYETVPCGALAAAAESVPAPELPESTAIAPALLAEPDGRPFAELRARHAGYTITSYTRMQPQVGHRPAEDAEEFQGEAADDAPQANPDELPGGAETGVFLHEVLAEIDPAWIGAATDFDAFAELPEASRLFASLAARHGIARRHLAHAKRLVWAALRGPIYAGDAVGVIDGLHRVARPLREMEFLFPIPEASHALLGRAAPTDGERFEVRRGLIKGYMDLLFEHGGRAFFADWKSNSLRRFDDASVREEVERTYRLQAKLYTLALVRMMRIRDEATYEARFGGLLYLFLRGMRPDGDGRAGVYFERPAFTDVLAWERELLERRSFGPTGAASGGTP